MKNDLKVIRTINGDILLAELFMTEDRDRWVLSNPFIIDFINEVSASPFLPGANRNSFEVEKTFVVTYGEPDDYMSSFYGSVLFRYLSNLWKNVPPSHEDHPKIKEKLNSLRARINADFGMLCSEEDISGKYIFPPSRTIQ